MSIMRISLFGKFQVRCEERALAGFEPRKAQELFGYLLLHRHQPHCREILAELLWGDSPNGQSKKYLRQALWQLQTALSSQASLLTEPILQLEPDWIHVNVNAGFWLDVAELERGFDYVQTVPAHRLDSQAARSLHDAVELYRGDLLEGCYHDWCLFERERLQNMCFAMLDKLTDYCEEHADYESGIAYGERILRIDRARERTHGRMMRLHYLAGDRTAALHQYERCVAALEEELGVRPAGRTVALCEQIRADQLVKTAAAPAADTAAAELATSSLPDVIGHLRQLQSLLADAQRQIQDGIQAVEMVLNGRR